MVWATRLASAGAGKNGIDHLSFSSISTFVDWAKQENLRNTLYLVDYEFLNQDMNGLEAIDQAGIAKNSILVTSRYEELKVREHAKRMGIKMIPKALAPLVPIVIEKSLLYDACLIDDDPLIHLTWETAAGSAGKSLRCFFSAEQFFSEASNIEKSTPLYVDVHLGNGIRGEEISRKILDLGFTQIFLATGYEPEKILTPSVQVKIVGKEPPF
jgi:hypothetical protein